MLLTGMPYLAGELLFTSCKFDSLISCFCARSVSKVNSDLYYFRLSEKEKCNSYEDHNCV
jgi:hypothetical protein